MRKIRGVSYSLLLLTIINFVAILFNGILYQQASKYIIGRNQSYDLLQRLDRIPSAPTNLYWSSLLLFTGIVLMIIYRRFWSREAWSILDRRNLIEMLLLLALLWVQHFTYNGIVLLVFADIFYGSKEFSGSRDRRYWFAFIFLSFMMLLLSNYDLLSLFIPLPSLISYIDFYPAGLRILILLVKNALISLNIIVFIISLLFYILYIINEHHHIEQELAMVSNVNRELNSYVALSEKIAEDRERKRIAREIHDSLGHALTGISAGIDAVGVLIDLDRDRAKEQLKQVSGVVRTGIQDVRGSLKRLRPNALEQQGLQQALRQMIADYETLSHLKIDLHFEWADLELDVLEEDSIYRVIQESLTNAIRHGHAKKMRIHFLEGPPYQLILQDDGVGFEELELGYGLKQMQERIAILGGSIQFENRQGFYTHISLPRFDKKKGGSS